MISNHAIFSQKQFNIDTKIICKMYYIMWWMLIRKKCGYGFLKF
jgi:hypothetical protein